MHAVFPEDMLFLVQEGEHYDIGQLGLNKVVPRTNRFLVMEYWKVGVKKKLRLLYCSHEYCGKIFDGWYAFIDHLLIHTGERHFRCN